MKKQFTSKLHLNKETLRNLSDRDLKSAIGGASFNCVETGHVVLRAVRRPRGAVSPTAAAATPATRAAAADAVTPRRPGGTRPPHLPENAAMWQSIASADTSRECWSTIEEIDEGLAKIWLAATRCSMT